MLEEPASLRERLAACRFSVSVSRDGAATRSPASGVVHSGISFRGIGKNCSFRRPPDFTAVARCVLRSRAVIDRLNSLLRAELAAVAGYQKALGVVRKKAIRDGDHILRLAAEHQRTVAALHGSVQARGGVPVAAAAAWEGSDSDALTAEGGMRLERREFMAALLEVERRGLAAYEAALATLEALDADARELVELELVPRQRRHVEMLSAMLLNLAA